MSTPSPPSQLGRALRVDSEEWFAELQPRAHFHTLENCPLEWQTGPSISRPRRGHQDLQSRAHT